MSASPIERIRRRGGQAGFTLIEALVAFAALAMVLAVALPLFAGGMRSVDTADQRMSALALAESKIADATATWPTPFGLTEGGDAAGRLWQLRVEPLATMAGSTPMLVRYEVSVASPGGGFENGVRLVTYRLLRREAP